MDVETVIIALLFFSIFVLSIIFILNNTAKKKELFKCSKKCSQKRNKIENFTNKKKIIETFYNSSGCSNFKEHPNSYCYPGVKGQLLFEDELKNNCETDEKCKGYILYNQNQGDKIGQGYLCRDNWSGTLNQYNKTNTYECQKNCECPEGFEKVEGSCDPRTGIAICKPPIDTDTKTKIDGLIEHTGYNLTSPPEKISEKIDKIKNHEHIHIEGPTEFEKDDKGNLKTYHKKIQHIHYPDDTNKLKEFKPGDNKFSTFNSSRYLHSLGDKISIESSEDDPYNFKTKITIDKDKDNEKEINSELASYRVEGASTNDLVYGQVHKYTSLSDNDLLSKNNESIGSGYIQSVNNGNDIKYDFNQKAWEKNIKVKDAQGNEQIIPKYVQDSLSDTNLDEGKCSYDARFSLAGYSRDSHYNAPGWDLYNINKEDNYVDFIDPDTPQQPFCYSFSGNTDYTSNDPSISSYIATYKTDSGMGTSASTTSL
tara:strand:- start:3799 stop:5244 length:1446 start_codon:yes stop_codon:yes gene_type:complete